MIAVPKRQPGTVAFLLVTAVECLIAACIFPGLFGWARLAWGTVLPLSHPYCNLGAEGVCRCCGAPLQDTQLGASRSIGLGVLPERLFLWVVGCRPGAVCGGEFSLVVAVAVLQVLVSDTGCSAGAASLVTGGLTCLVRGHCGVLHSPYQRIGG